MLFANNYQKVSGEARPTHPQCCPGSRHTAITSQCRLGSAWFRQLNQKTTVTWIYLCNEEVFETWRGAVQEKSILTVQQGPPENQVPPGMQEEERTRDQTDITATHWYRCELCNEAVPVTSTTHGLVLRCVYHQTAMRETDCPHPVFQSHICPLQGKYCLSQTFKGTCVWVFGLAFY